MKALSNIWRTVALSACAAMVVNGMTACSNEDNIVNEEQTPAAQQEGLKVTLTATFDEGAGTRGVSFDGTTSTSTFADGDKLYIYNVTKSALEPNRLTITGISADGKSATFSGTLSGTYEASDALKLYYNLYDFDSNNSNYCRFDYTFQTGSATSASACDYAMTNAQVGTISGGTLTLALPVTLTKMQSVFRQRLTFKNSSNATIATPTITSLKISSKSDKLCTRYFLNSGDAQDPITIGTPTIDANGDIYLALRFAAGSPSNDALTLTAIDSEGNQYECTKDAPNGGFKNGRYYHGAMTMAWARQLVKPTVSRSDDGSVPEPDQYNWYNMDLKNGTINMTISGISKGYGFYLIENWGNKTVTLNDLDATYDGSAFIYSFSSVTINLSGANSITCKKSSQCITASGSDLKLSGNGTLTVTVNNNSRYGLYAGNNYNDSSHEVSALAAEGYTVTRSEMTNNGNGTYTWTYTVAPTQ